MERIFVALLVTLHYCAAAQSITEVNFDEHLLSYTPPQRAGISDKNFGKGTFILDDIKSATKGNVKNLNVADYWNATIAFINLGESKEIIALAFKKAIAGDSAAVCEYCAVNKSDLGVFIPEVYYPFFETCKQQIEVVDYKAYWQKNKLDSSLVKKIAAIHMADIRYRKSDPIDWKKQNLLDKQNQQSVDSLFSIHKAYIGSMLVGDNLNFVMWAVIQHSSLEMMNRYLPVLEKAVKENQLPVIPFKMLLDRMYSIQFSYQIFGSQANVPLAAEEIRTQVKKKYQIE